MPRLTLIGGPSGSGKTTLAKHIWRATAGSFHFETDNYFVDALGEYRFDATKLGDAHGSTQMMVRDTMLRHPNADIIISNTFAAQWERKPYIDLAKHYGYEWVWMPMFTSLNDEELAARNVHGVPVATIRKQRARMTG